MLKVIGKLQQKLRHSKPGGFGKSCVSSILRQNFSYLITHDMNWAQWHNIVFRALFISLLLNRPFNDISFQYYATIFAVFTTVGFKTSVSLIWLYGQPTSLSLPLYFHVSIVQERGVNLWSLKDQSLGLILPLTLLLRLKMTPMPST